MRRIELRLEFDAAGIERHGPRPFRRGSSELEALINGYPQSIGNAYLQVDGQTVSSEFNYGTLTNFLSLSPGAHSLEALDILGYRVGPIKSASLSAGKDYTLILVGTYPNYRVLAFEEPASSKGKVQLSLYEASPAVPGPISAAIALRAVKV